ncbi:uncharacterized protein LOC135844758 [Planococcus citri]|uniref:uncharacterized protein LOC135844758 n=1 Tax=Planococcus citri TaxID=170843 RepID=UPI0031F9C893
MSNELEKKTFPNGRHRNKTYLDVFETDREFCEMVLRGEKSRFIPDDFLNFLSSKMESVSLQNCISERNGIHFVKAFDEEMAQDFRDIIGRPRINVEQVHPPCNGNHPNGFLGVFYHFFVQKHIANITNTDGYCKYLDSYAAIFPFPVIDRVVRQEIDILNSIDEDLFTEMQMFLNQHFDDVGIRSISAKFFDNIMNFRQKNVPEKAILAAVKGLNLKGLTNDNRSCENFNDKFYFANDRCEYLKTYPRVNHTGVLRYQTIYEMIVNVTKQYGKSCNSSPAKYEPKYLLKLPEINLYELYSLLNVNFLRSDRREYIYRFKKYLLFFVNALNNPAKPVFFIDEGLYDCLLYYSTYRKSRNDVERMKFELSMLTLAYRRKQSFDESQARGTYNLNNTNLRDVKKYFDNFPGIANALVKNEILSNILESQAFVSTDRVAMDVCFRNAVRNQHKDFFELVIHGSLSPNNYRYLVIYNAYTGQETSIAMPSNKAAVVDFIKRYNKYDFSQVLPPEKFLTWGHECYYQGDVANWDSRRKLRY